MATWFILTASLAVFCWSWVVFLAVRRRIQAREDLVRQRLAIGQGADQEDERGILQKRGEEGLFDELLGGTSTYHRLSDLLEQAGSTEGPGAFLAKSLILGLVPAMFMGLLTMSAGGAIIGMSAGLIPLAMLLRTRRRRMQKIDAQLPTALEIMTISLRAGHSLAQTIELSARELQPPIRDEFERAAQEHALGRPIDEVLVAMSRRLPDCKALRTFVVSVLVLTQTGGNLIEIIEKIIETLRMQTQYERKLAAMTSEGRSSARMLSALPVVFILLAYLADPSYVSLLFTDPTGQKLLGMSVLLWIVGVLWTRKLTSPAT